MTKPITVKDLRDQLNMLVESGYGDGILWYRDEDSYDHQFIQGVWDSEETDDGLMIALA